MKLVRIFRKNNCWRVEKTDAYIPASNMHYWYFKKATEFCKLQQLKLLENKGITVRQLQHSISGTPKLYRYAVCRNKDFLFTIESRSSFVSLHVLHEATYLAMQRGHLKYAICNPRL